MSAETAPLSLGGNLADFSLADILAFLNMEQASGAIEAVNGRHVHRIFLSKGEVVFAVGRSSRFSLPGFLAARGLLTERAAGDLAARAERLGVSFSQLVTEGGHVEAAELATLEKILCMEIVFESMLWREGSFGFIRGRKPPDSAPALNISLQNLILEGARRLDESLRYGQLVDVDRGLVVTLVFPSGRLDEQVVLTPIEWGVVSLVNGKRSLDEIFALSPAPSETETWRVLERLRSVRMIQFHPREEQADAAAEPRFMGTSISVQVGRVLTGMPLPTAPAAGSAEATAELREKTDAGLLSDGTLTTAHGMFGPRVPARLVGSMSAGEPALAFDLLQPVLTIGRAPSNDIVLTDPSVSKHHVRLAQEGDA